MTLPTPPRDLREHAPAGRIITPDPAAVARFMATMAQQRAAQPTPQAEAVRRQYSGDRIAANIQRAAEAGYAKRRFVLSDEAYADVMARRESKEAWTRIAADYDVSHTTLMNATARYRAEQRKAEREAQRCR